MRAVFLWLFSIGLLIVALWGCGFPAPSPPRAPRAQKLETVLICTVDTLLGERREAAYSVKAEYVGTTAEMNSAQHRACALFESAPKREQKSLQACLEEVGFTNISIWKP